MTRRRCQTRTDLRTTWDNIRQRCYNPRSPKYRAYGARGIRVLWGSYAAFAADVSPRPAGHVLHRKDHDGPYCKTNCVWVTKAEHRAIHNRLGRWAAKRRQSAGVAA